MLYTTHFISLEMGYFVDKLSRVHKIGMDLINEMWQHPQNTVISSAFLASQPSKLNSYDVRTLSYYLEFTKLLTVIHINALM